MRVIVEAVSGPGKGRNLTLKPGDVVVIGRTEWSDVCIGSDQQMSARHFSIESGQNGLRLVDQGSTNGTQVNGEFIKEAPLYDGDQIVAGTTTFKVKIEQATTTPAVGSPPGSSGINPFGEPNPSPYTPVEIGGAGPLGAPDIMPSGGNPFDDQVVYTGDSAPPKRPPLPRDNPIYWEGDGPTSVEPPSGSGNVGTPIDSPIIMEGAPSAGAAPPSTPSTGDTPFGSDTPFAEPPQPSEAEVQVTPPPHPGESRTASGAAVPTPPPPPPGYRDAPIDPTSNLPPTAKAAKPGVPPTRQLSGSDFVAATPAEGPSERAKPVYDTSRNITPATPDMLQYSMHACKSSLVKCMRSNFGGAPSEFQPSSIMVQLQRSMPLLALLHFQKGGLEYPAELTDATPLLYWLPDESARNFGPVLVPQTQQLDRLAAVDALWDSDAAVCVYARDAEAAKKHLLKLLKYNMNGGSDENGIFGYCWPSVIGSLLECQTDEIVEVILGDVINFVFIEVPGQPGNWQIFGSEEQLASIGQLGFREVPLEESTPT